MDEVWVKDMCARPLPCFEAEDSKHSTPLTMDIETIRSNPGTWLVPTPDQVCAQFMTITSPCHFSHPQWRIYHLNTPIPHPTSPPASSNATRQSCTTTTAPPTPPHRRSIGNPNPPPYNLGLLAQCRTHRQTQANHSRSRAPVSLVIDMLLERHVFWARIFRGPDQRVNPWIPTQNPRFSSPQGYIGFRPPRRRLVASSSAFG